MKVFIGLFLPFLGTCLGASFIFFIQKEMNKLLEKFILSFAAGVMLAASIWSLLLPSLEQTSLFVVVIGLLSGCLFFKLLDFFIEKNNIKKDKMLLAIHLHNIPEGMAIGVLLAYFLEGKVFFLECLLLSIGIALQNVPEGLIVSLPEWKNGKSKFNSFKSGIVSALFELGGGIVTLLFTKIVSGILPFCLSFASSAMLYVIVTELIPESKDKNTIMAFYFGFLLMMCLDCLF